jgi:monoterpene epsilon-lactone hydrolase
MASPENAELIEMMRSMNPLGSGDIEQIRKGMEMAPPYPQPQDVAWETVVANGVECEWNTPSEAEAGRTIVYYHGGGYAIGSVRGHRGLCSNLARGTRARVLSVEYRMAPENPYPAAVEDAVAAYRFVLDQGADPSKVAVGGDSAGGGLALAALISLKESGDPLPGAGICLSPWVDLTLSNASIERVAPQDPMLSPEILRVFRDAYLAGGDPKAPTASPIFGELAGLPPLLIQAGSSEVLVGEIEDFAARAKAQDVDVTLDIWQDMIHVWPTFADMLPEGRRAIADIGKFLDARL